METILSLNSVIVATDPQKTGAPEWVQILPVGEFSGEDGRGPYKIDDAEALIAHSMKGGRKLPLDENHATDVAMKGQSTPARGWIIELQARADGIWGRIEWTNAGRKLIEEREYGYISPAFMHTRNAPHRVTQILRASLVNEPNLMMKSIHNKEKQMNKELHELLGLDDGADDKSIMSALRDRLEAGTALQKVMTTIAKALDLKEDANGDDVVTSLNARLVATTSQADPEDKSEVEELKAEIKSLNSKLADVVSTNARAVAETVVDKAIADVKLVPPLRDHFIARHMKNPKEVEDELKLMPSLNSGSLSHRKAVETEAGALSPVDDEVCALMELDLEAFAKQAKQTEKEYH